MHILIAGGTGTAGRVLARQLTIGGHQVRVLARRRPADPHERDVVAGDLTTGAGLDQAMADIDVAVDVSNVSTSSRRKASAFFTEVVPGLVEVEVAVPRLRPAVR